jgi:hypothetical protein
MAKWQMKGEMRGERFLSAKKVLYYVLGLTLVGVA